MSLAQSVSRTPQNPVKTQRAPNGARINMAMLGSYRAASSAEADMALVLGSLICSVFTQPIL